MADGSSTPRLLDDDAVRELLGVRREVTEYLVGHQPAGTGPRHYIEAERAMWPELLEAVRRIPALPPRPVLAEVLPLRRGT